MMHYKRDDVKQLGPAALLALALFVLLASAACASNDVATPDPESGSAEASVGPAGPALLIPTPTPRILSHAINREWLVSPSLEEQIFTSKFIVVASLLSAAADTETVRSGQGVAPTYRALQTLRFRVHEYLKGTGPNEIAVAVRSLHSYLTEAEAQRVAAAQVSQRSTAWDDRRGVLFLKTLLPPLPPDEGASGTSASSLTLEFTLSNHYVQSEWEYSIDTLSRAWLPAQESAGASGQAGQAFITDGSQEPTPTVSLADLRSKIAENKALLEAGEGVAGYIDCLYGKHTRERLRRADPWTPTQKEATANSGSAAGLEVYSGSRTESYPEYHNYWLSGPAPELFQALIVDNDSEPSNGYDHRLVTARPLPRGSYRVFYNKQHYQRKPCNFKPTDAYVEWTVTVTAPAGTVHEAFFDPAAVGTAVGADASNGVLKPSAFTVGGTATTMQGLKWENGSVVLTLSPYTALTGVAIDFIALDGSVTFSLHSKDATADAAAGTLTWAVESAPWQAGDKLMLRIREATARTPTTTPTPTPAPTATPEPNAAPVFNPASYSFSVAENAKGFHVIGTVSASDSNEGDVVTYYITAGNDAGRFNITHNDGLIVVRGALDYETASSYTLTVEARDGNGGKATATVEITVTDVAE